MPNTLEELEIIVKADVSKATEALDKLKSQIEGTKGDIDKNVKDIATSVSEGSEQIKKTIDSLLKLLQKSGKISADTAKTIGESVAKIAPQVAQGAEATGGLSASVAGLGSAIASVLPIIIAVVAILLAVTAIIKGIKKQLDKTKEALIKGSKVVLKFLKETLVNAIQKAEKILKKYKGTIKSMAREGVNNLVQVSNRLNKAMSDLKGSTMQLSNALATALAPIIEYLTPLFVSLMNVIIQVINTIAQLTTGLFSSEKKYRKAKSVIIDYRKEVAGATKANKNLLASFDELNVLNENEGEGAGLPNPEDMFTLDDIEQDILNLTEHLKGIKAEVEIEIKKGNYRQAGEIVGDEVNKMLQSLPAEDWGRKLGRKIENAIEFANGFLSKRPFGELGAKLAQYLLGLFDEITPEEVGELLANIINNAFEFVNRFVSEVKIQDGFRKLGASIATALKNMIANIDVETMADTINNVVIGILDMGLAFFDQWKDEEGNKEIKSKLDDLVDRIEWGEIWAKFIALAWEAWKLKTAIKIRIKLEEIHALWEFIKDILNACIEKLKKKVQEDIEQAKKAWTAFVSIISYIWDKIVEWWNANVAKYFTLQWWKDLFTNVKSGLSEGAQEALDETIGKISKGIEEMITTIQTKFNEAKEKIKGFGESVKSSISSGWENFKVNIGFGSDDTPKMASGGVLTKPTAIIAGEYAGASRNPEIVSPQSLMYETNMKANVPVINAVEEMTDRLVVALQNIGVYAEFDYDKMRVGINKEQRRVGNKFYGGAYV